MKNKCQGCGAVVQTENKNLPGYIRRDVLAKQENEFYCERCFNLTHYNRKIDIKIDEEEFRKNIEALAKRDVLVVNIVDIFDLEGTVIYDLDKLFPRNRKLIVGNKFDLFLDSVKKEKVKNYFQDYLHRNNISFTETILISSFKKADIELLIEVILRLKGKKDVCFIGTTNVGKSTLINGVIRKLGLNYQPLTTSAAISTTLGLVNISLPDGSDLIDTPGLPNHRQANYYLSHKHQELLAPKKFIRPKVYQLLPSQTLFIGGFCRLDFTSGLSSSFVVYVPQAIKIHRTKITNASEFYQLHKDDILKVPNAEEREKLGDFRKYHFSFKYEKKDISISGLGFITLIGEGEVDFYCFEKIKVGFRSAII